MSWTRHHGAVLAKALEAVLGRPERGGMAFVRCLTPDVVDALARDVDAFRIPDWRVWRVADAEDEKSANDHGGSSCRDPRKQIRSGGASRRYGKSWCGDGRDF